MVKRTITCKTLDGVEYTQDLYFNFRKHEILEMELGRDGRLTDTLQRIIDAKDVPSLLKEFKTLILSAYGEKSPDGKRFIKSPEISASFEQSEAYDAIYMKMVTDDDYASQFIKELIPETLINEIVEMQNTAASKTANVTALPGN